MPPLAPDGAVYTTTDRGAAVRLDSALTVRPPDQLRPVEDRILGVLRWHDRLIRRGPADDQTNCFGWVFTGGRYWLEHDQVVGQAVRLSGAVGFLMAIVLCIANARLAAPEHARDARTAG